MSFRTVIYVKDLVITPAPTLPDKRGFYEGSQTPEWLLHGPLLQEAGLIKQSKATNSWKEQMR